MPLHPAYIAGFFDGEGCIHARVGKGDLQVSISQKVQGPLPDIAAQFGGTVRRMKTGMYTWLCPVGSVRDFLQTIAPYVVVKRDQVALGIEWLHWGQRGWSEPRTKSARRERQDYNAKRVAVRQQLEHQLREAKLEGRIC